ncbi:hypothetical protein [Kitasatospora sp. NPDC091207]|uniref:hypothetical protein n=1 Tax=Kitasatospora sp. NPDC091207 TaxID=3364083 RepID=UPI0037F1061D
MPERNAETECPGCLYFDGTAAQYPADVNPTIARHLVRRRQRHTDDGERENRRWTRMSDHQDNSRTALQGLSEEPEPVDPFKWIRAHPWPREYPSGPRPVLTPEEHAEVPLTAEERQRRALLLARLREANHRRH